MDFNIRQEQIKDYEAVHKVVELAFRDMEDSDHNEPFLVDQLRQTDAFIPELSLVAEVDEEIIGHILMTKVEIVSENKSVTSLGLAPVSVLPEYQNRGIGSALIREAHKRATELGYGSVVLLGHKDYYPRFGYKQAIDSGIEFPFDVPHAYCMAIELRPKRRTRHDPVCQTIYGITENRKQGKTYPFSYCMEINIPKELKK